MGGDTGEMGCDHHGTGTKPCSCDFCVSGKKVTDKIMKEKRESQSGFGLQLSSGPDPRSFNPMLGAFNDMMRGVLGLDT